MPFCYYSLLGRVIDFPSRVRVQVIECPSEPFPTRRLKESSTLQGLQQQLLEQVGRLVEQAWKIDSNCGAEAKVNTNLTMLIFSISNRSTGQQVTGSGSELTFGKGAGVARTVQTMASLWQSNGVARFCKRR